MAIDRSYGSTDGFGAAWGWLQPPSLCWQSAYLARRCLVHGKKGVEGQKLQDLCLDGGWRGVDGGQPAHLLNSPLPHPFNLL